MKNKILLAFIFSFVTSCNGLSGKYQSESGFYYVKFINSTKCMWYQDGSLFEGTYKKNGNGYLLEIKGSGFYAKTIFNATIDKNDLIITGDIINKERFVKSGKKKEKAVNIPEHVSGSLYVNRKVPKSEYEKMMLEKELREREVHRKTIEMGESYKKQKEDWIKNFEQTIKKRAIMEEVVIKSKPEETQNAKTRGKEVAEEAETKSKNETKKTAKMKEKTIIEETEIKSKPEEKKIEKIKEKIDPAEKGIEEAKQYKIKSYKDERIEQMLKEHKLKKY
jgi:hypothetical protein